jgi:hypothetical protein
VADEAIDRMQRRDRKFLITIEDPCAQLFVTRVGQLCVDNGNVP